MGVYGEGATVVVTPREEAERILPIPAESILRISRVYDTICHTHVRIMDMKTPDSRRQRHDAKTKGS